MESIDNTLIIPTGQKRKATADERKQFSALFDSSDDSDDEERHVSAATWLFDLLTLCD